MLGRKLVQAICYNYYRSCLMEKKKQLIILVLRMLESESDAQHPLTQTEMTKVISEIYPCDRKTVCRNVQFLREMGYPIVKTTKGFYMDNKAFSNAEIAFVEKAILAAEDLSNEEKKTLSTKVVDYLTKRYSK